jgi:hypothetical protein
MYKMHGTNSEVRQITSTAMQNNFKINGMTKEKKKEV